MTRMLLPLVIATATVFAPPALAAEKPPELSAGSLLGEGIKGPNWTVGETVRSDGFVRLYAVETPYGNFQVNGQHRMNERLQELRALNALEQMSKAEVFVDAVGNAGMAPVRFGRDLVLDPVETTGNLVSGIANMFDKAVSEVEQRSASRDDFVESVIGVKKAMRELAFALKVDPYTDFTPLRDGLEDVARVMAAGDISVSAAISVIPGGAGVAVSASSTASNLANPVRDKSSAEIADLVSSKLKKLSVAKDSIDAFVENHAYSPGDQYAIAEALSALKAEDSTVFVKAAAKAESADVAKFHRYRAEFLAKHTTKLGNLKSFVDIAEFALNRDAAGNVVAAFPFDGLEWTDAVARSLTNITVEVATSGATKAPVFATTGKISAYAAAELKNRGWRIVQLD